MVYTAGARRARPLTVGSFWCSLLVIFGFLVHGIAAMVTPTFLDRNELVLNSRQVVGNAVAMADKLAGHSNTHVQDSNLDETRATPA